jgi:hypothetical protein
MILSSNRSTESANLQSTQIAAAPEVLSAVLQTFLEFPIKIYIHALKFLYGNRLNLKPSVFCATHLKDFREEFSSLVPISSN